MEHSGIERSKSFTGINLLAQAASGSYFFPQKVRKTVTEWSSAKLNSSLKPRSALRSKTFDTKEVHPSTIVKNLLGDTKSECRGFASLFYCPRSSYSVSASSSLQFGSMSPLKYLAFKDDLLACGVKGRKTTDRSSVHFALGQDSQSKEGTGGLGTLGTAPVALRSRDEHRLNSLDLCGTFYQGKVSRRSANEDKRNLIISIASKELGTREATDNNDGPRVEEYLRYTNLGKGYDWCAAFVSWSYGQAGFSVPRNPWSPALFPKARQISKDQCRSADVFGIYGSAVKRINHVGLVKEKQGQYLVTIEGNSNNRVESRRRHLKTVYAMADWVAGNYY
ncbi:hypothetical protein M472_09355 [Sphingobacterium paucimobilis HER1398]|uniref:Peptidase C51 domain-containing protein n=1 Tax=Sphingobacterium paucimobilis HER1398 TaxID=1346330 RepID=U2HUL9_9SPHI|nr:hypothetical protein M472_09355 [Sphingobacterium paucimobilis HER1398]